MTMAERIAEHAILLKQGNLDEVVDWLRKVGRTVEVMEDGTVSVDGVGGIKIGISTGLDTTTAVVQLLFAVFGSMWAILPEGQEAFKLAQKIERSNKK